MMVANGDQQKEKGTHKNMSWRFLAIISILSFCVYITALYARGTTARNVPQALPRSYAQHVSSAHKLKAVFIETQPRAVCLTSRQICSIESMIRKNPSFIVQLSARQELNKNYSECPYNQIIDTFSNFLFHKINESTLFEDTPLDDWWGKLMSGEVTTPYPTEVISDAMRLAFLYKHANVYSDLDVIIIRPLLDLLQFEGVIGFQDSSSLNNAFLAFSRRSDFVKQSMAEFATNFNGDAWGYNGPSLLNRMLEKMDCTLTPSTICQGIFLAPSEVLYPLPYQTFELMFEPALTTELLAKFTENTYAFHLWNNLSKGTPSSVHEANLLNVLAALHCPSTFKLARQGTKIF